MSNKKETAKKIIIEENFESFLMTATKKYIETTFLDVHAVIEN